MPEHGSIAVVVEQERQAVCTSDAERALALEQYPDRDDDEHAGGLQLHVHGAA